MDGNIINLVNILDNIYIWVNDHLVIKIWGFPKLRG